LEIEPALRIQVQCILKKKLASFDNYFQFAPGFLDFCFMTTFAKKVPLANVPPRRFTPEQCFPTLRFFRELGCYI